MKKAIMVPALLILLTLSNASLQAAEICLSFERLPFMEPLIYWTPREISSRVLRELEKRNIQAIGFVQEEKLLDMPSSGIVLLDWAGKGHLLGNNTFSYVDFNELSVKEFLEHVADGQGSILRASRVSGNNYRYLRFPSMHHGNSEEKRNRIKSTLYKNNYTVFPATVIPFDYEFNWVFRDHVEDEEAIDILREMYLDYLIKCLEQAEELSREVFGQEIPQIVRLHIGIATSQFLSGFLERLEKRGDSFITPEKALEHPAFKPEENYITPLGLSLVERVAAERGIKFDPGWREIDRRDIRQMIDRKLEEAAAGSDP